MAADLDALKAEIEALDAPDRLRLAAGLLEHGKTKIAHSIAERVVLELGAALALQQKPEAG